MANEPWLADLLGYRRVQVGPTGAVQLPMRSTLRLLSGFEATDDPVNGVTAIVAVGGAGGGGGSSWLRWEVSSEAERLALPLTQADVGKVARQIEQNGDSSFWVLARVSGGVVWRQLDNALGAAIVTLQAAGLMSPSMLQQLQAATAAAAAAQSAADAAATAASSAQTTASAASSAASALRAPTYIVQSATAALDNERALEVAGALGIDWTQPGKVVITAPSGGMTTEQANALTAATAGVAALRTPTYIVQSATTELSNERTLLCTAPLAANWAAAGQVTLSMPAATASAPGHMTAAQAQKLDGIAVGANVGAPVGAQYLVAATDSTLTNERVLSGAQGITVDFATAGQAIVKGPAGGVAPANAQYLVAATDGTLTAERVLEGAGGLSVDFSQAGKAVVGPGTLRLPVPSYMDVTAAPITGTAAKHLFQIPALTVTAADVGRIALDVNSEAYLLVAFQEDLEGEGVVT